MVVSNLSSEGKASDLLMHLNSSNLHYSAQVTPFSLTLQSQRTLGKISNFVIPDQTSQQPSNSSMPSETLNAMKRDFDNELKQTALEYNEIKVEKELPEEKLENVKDSNDDLKTKLEEKSLESHEIKITNKLLLRKLQKTEAGFLKY